MKQHEQNWNDGFHVSSSGKSTPLGDMVTSHLKNTINKYKREGYDTSALEDELATREDEIEPTEDENI